MFSPISWGRRIRAIVGIVLALIVVVLAWVVLRNVRQPCVRVYAFVLSPRFHPSGKVVSSDVERSIRTDIEEIVMCEGAFVVRRPRLEGPYLKEYRTSSFTKKTDPLPGRPDERETEPLPERQVVGKASGGNSRYYVYLRVTYDKSIALQVGALLERLAAQYGEEHCPNLRIRALPSMDYYPWEHDPVVSDEESILAPGKPAKAGGE